MPEADDLRRRLESQYEGFQWQNTGANAYLSEDIIQRVRDAARKASIGEPEPKILDVGCGSGHIVSVLADDMFASVAVGVDVLPRFESQRGVQFVVGDARFLPFQSSTFDLTTVMTTLSSIPSAEHRRIALMECLRVTKQGGTILIYDFVYKNPLNRFTRPVSVHMILQALRPSANLRVERVTLNPVLARMVFALRIPYARAICDYLAKVAFLRHHVLIQAVKSPA